MGRPRPVTHEGAARARGRRGMVPRGLGALKVLIADDDLLVRKMLADLLTELGHVVVAAENGAQAVDLCAREAPDLLILDFLMPKLSGLDALHTLRERGERAPVVLLTAISDGSFRAVEGADAVHVLLPKPVTRRALERALARATRPGPGSVKGRAGGDG